MPIEIKSWLTGEVLHTIEANTLVGADLRCANLSDADLRCAKLSDADLRCANLSDADLRCADLRCADLRCANLRGADLRCADLSGADLSGAKLSDADLSDAKLSDANLSGADLRCAKYQDVPMVPDIKKTILNLVETGQGQLKMNQWHTCETVHCLAGWAVHLGGKEAYKLEAENNTATIGALIFHKSCGEIPDFYSTDEAAIEWLKK